MESPASQAAVPVAETSDANLLRRADAAGQRLFRELVVSRIAWATVSEVTRLIAVDVVGFSLRATGCAHPQPCQCQPGLNPRSKWEYREPGWPKWRWSPKWCRWNRPPWCPDP